MGKFLKQISIFPKPLQYKLTIAFALMSIIPLMICVYFATNFIFPKYHNIGAVSLVVVITAIITFFGLPRERDDRVNC